MNNQQSKIITFYSYKGGTGRTMILANIAWILASNGKQVLVIYWDLEAPGLHRYFHPFISDKELIRTEGLIDFLMQYAVVAVTPSDNTPSDWYTPYTNILNYAISLEWEFPNKGTIDFVCAGKQDFLYSSRVNSFDWDHFYEKLCGGIFLEKVKERILDEYDYILIDSRTGVSDTSGICTVQMPQLLVVFFTANNQSIIGANNIVSSVIKQWQKNPESYHNEIFPVLARTESFEDSKLSTTRNHVKQIFNACLPGDVDSEKYWGDVYIPYKSAYAFEEILATFHDDPNLRESLLVAIEHLVFYLTKGTVHKLVQPDLAEKQKVLSEFSRHLAIPMIFNTNIQPGGTLEPTSPIYVERLTDYVTEASINDPRKILIIVGPWQSGKSSLLLRTVHRIKQYHYNCIPAHIDFQKFGSNDFQTIDTVWKKILSIISEQIDIQCGTWDNSLNYQYNVSRLISCFESHYQNNFLLFCFDVEPILYTSIKSTFFSSIRSFYNQGASEKKFKKLSWLIATPISAANFIDEGSSLPISKTITLEMFNKSEIKKLAEKMGLKEIDEFWMNDIYEYVGGHPYFTHVLLNHLKDNQSAKNTKQLIHEKNIFSEELNYHLKRLQRQPELGNEMKAIIQKKSIKENEQLKAFGLIRNDGKNGMIPMGKLVTEFFMKHL
jgi:cellulose biosynthesis protein BcsQ